MSENEKPELKVISNEEKRKQDVEKLIADQPPVETTVEQDESSKRADKVFAELREFCNEKDVDLVGGIFFRDGNLSGPVVFADNKVKAAGLCKTIEKHINNIL